MLEKLLAEKKSLYVVALELNSDMTRKITKFLLTQEGRQRFLYRHQHKIRVRTLDGLHLDTPANRKRLRRKIY